LKVDEGELLIEMLPNGATKKVMIDNFLYGVGVLLGKVYDEEYSSTEEESGKKKVQQFINPGLCTTSACIWKGNGTHSVQSLQLLMIMTLLVALM
jgi:hypothetical protein